jgi:hypothetical protein
MANPFEFLQEWARNHVTATVYHDKTEARRLADECLRAAKKAGVSVASLIKAASGSLVSYMQAELDSAADREVKRLADKDD